MHVRRLVMLGPDPSVHGNASCAMNVYRAGGLFERWPLLNLATHCDGNVARQCAVMLEALSAFVALVAADRLAAVHAHVSSPSSFWRKCIFLLLAFAVRKPVIVQLDGANFIVFYERSRGPSRHFVRFVLEHAAYVVVMSERRQVRIAHIAPRARIAVVPDPLVLPDTPIVARRPFELFTAAGANEAAGVCGLLEVIAVLRRTHPELRLVCAAAGEVDLLRRRAAELGIGDAVEVMGWLSASERQDRLARCMALVAPPEGGRVPKCILEAMASGTAVVAGASATTRRIIDHGIEGLLVPAGDLEALKNALNLLLSRPQLAHEMGARGRRRIGENCSAGVIIPQIEALYEALGLVSSSARAGRSTTPAFEFTEAGGEGLYRWRGH